jgi:hypothetical protein
MAKLHQMSSLMCSPSRCRAQFHALLLTFSGDLILVSHAYLGGTYAGWWQTYENALARPDVKWRQFDEWVRAVKVDPMPLAEIPVNREVKYDTPQPAIPLERLQRLQGL